MSKKITVCLPWNNSFGGGDMYELVPYKDTDMFLIRPVKEDKFNKMTKKELIEYIEALS